MNGRQSNRTVFQFIATERENCRCSGKAAANSRLVTIHLPRWLFRVEKYPGSNSIHENEINGPPRMFSVPERRSLRLRGRRGTERTEPLDQFSTKHGTLAITAASALEYNSAPGRLHSAGSTPFPLYFHFIHFFAQSAPDNAGHIAQACTV